MSNETKNFLVSVADFAYYVNDILACTGTTNVNSSIEVSMQDQEVTGGKGNNLQYSFKYGRRLKATLEAADWNLAYIAMQTGSNIFEGLDEVYRIAECVDIVDGVGKLKSSPIGDVAVELSDGSIVTVTPNGSTIDTNKFNVKSGTVNATYKYNNIAKVITVDSESTPMVGRLVLDADRHNNKLGKVGSVQIVIPSYQLSGNFTLNMTAEGVSSTSMEGTALAISGDRCSDGSNVYAYIKEFDDTQSAITVNEIAAAPAAASIAAGATTAISVVGLKGTLYSNIELENTACTFVSDAPETATVDEKGVITGVAAGEAKITVSYGDFSDDVKVTVTA